ncbi:MAG: hypothetical protein Q8L81_09105 [Bacteroidota bacterium]|nr:hypothetical protein [Bacteroidota bacterium]
MKNTTKTIKSLSDLRFLIRETMVKEDLISAESNPDSNVNNEPNNSETNNNNQKSLEPKPDAEKCLSQIQELLDWYFK